MKIPRIGLILMITGTMACTSGLDIIKTNEEARINYSNENYEVSLGQWQKLIEHYKAKSEEVPGDVYSGAGKAFMKLGNETEAMNYFDRAVWAEYADEEMYYMMAELYLNIDNLSREIDALEYYNDSFPDAGRITEVRARLFNAYIKSENRQQALIIWELLPDEVKSEDLLTDYFVVHRELGNEAICDELATRLLKENSENIPALGYLAEKYFWKAENLYQKEMKAYENNRTHKQYAKLLKALDTINADFKTALQYFEKLYNITAEINYAKYLGNIYTRFDDKKKAEYYYRLAE